MSIEDTYKKAHNRAEQNLEGFDRAIDILKERDRSEASQHTASNDLWNQLERLARDNNIVHKHLTMARYEYINREQVALMLAVNLVQINNDLAKQLEQVLSNQHVAYRKE